MNIETLQGILDIIQLLLGGINTIHQAWMMGRDIYNNIYNSN